MTGDPERIEADQVYIAPGRDQPGDDHQRRSRPPQPGVMWWISDEGVRYGIALRRLGTAGAGHLTASARQAPWPLIRVFAPERRLSRADAMTQHDTLAPVVGAEALPRPRRRTNWQMSQIRGSKTSAETVHGADRMAL